MWMETFQRKQTLESGDSRNTGQVHRGHAARRNLAHQFVSIDELPAESLCVEESSRHAL